MLEEHNLVSGIEIRYISVIEGKTNYKRQNKEQDFKKASGNLTGKGKLSERANERNVRPISTSIRYVNEKRIRGKTRCGNKRGKPRKAWKWHMKEYVVTMVLIQKRLGI